MTAPTIAFALATALAWLGLHRISRDAADALAIPATAVIWTATIVLVITWS